MIEQVDDEAVVYDEQAKVAHALKPLAAAVFTYANGNNSPGEIAELATYRLGHDVSEAEVREALVALEDCDLLEREHPSDQPRHGITRRTALKAFAAAGAGTMLISSVAAPLASAGLADNGDKYTCGSSFLGLAGNTNNGWVQPWWFTGTTNYDKTTGETSYSGSWSLRGAGSAGGPATSSDTYSLGGSCCASTGLFGSTCSGGKLGTYQCVPCDGNLNIGGTQQHFQCCEIVCVPNGTTVPGAVSTPSGESFLSTSPEPAVTGYGAYTLPAAAGGTIDGVTMSTAYPTKWCTNNPCNFKGDCS